MGKENEGVEEGRVGKGRGLSTRPSAAEGPEWGGLEGGEMTCANGTVEQTSSHIRTNPNPTQFPLHSLRQTVLADPKCLRKTKHCRRLAATAARSGSGNGDETAREQGSLEHAIDARSDGNLPWRLPTYLPTYLIMRLTHGLCIDVLTSGISNQEKNQMQWDAAMRALHPRKGSLRFHLRLFARPGARHPAGS